jgi:PEP-CTERM motif
MQSKWLSGLLVIACVALLSGVGFASACSDTTYDQYLGAGFNCTIGDKTFSNFAYHGTSNPPGFSIQAGSIDVTPITTPLNPGFQWSAGWHASTTSGVLSQDSLFQFTVNVNPGGNLITDVSLSIGGVGTSGTGSIAVDETVCLGATFPACTGGTVRELSVFQDSSGSQLFDEISFAGVSEVDVQKDVLVDAGTNGSARLSLLTNQFSETTTPEPASILLFGSGALALAGVLRRKIKH